FQIDPFGLSYPFYLVDNYTAAWQAISPFILNSIIYSGGSTIGVLALASFTAYVFARFRFPAKELLYYLIIVLLMIPPVLTLIPSLCWSKLWACWTRAGRSSCPTSPVARSLASFSCAASTPASRKNCLR